MVLDDLNLTIHLGEKVGILGCNGAGKSTLIRLISGAELPTSGSIQRGMSISWPLAFSGAFQGSLTGLDNLRFICRVYGVDFRPRVDYVEEFSELGHYMREPVKTYSSGMRARLAFAISMSIEFHCYLIDEVLAVGDAEFQRKCLDVFADLERCEWILVGIVEQVHALGQLKKHVRLAGIDLCRRPLRLVF